MKKLVPILITLSVAFNMAFLAMWVTHQITGRHASAPTARQDTGTCVIWSPLHQRLGVTTQQWKAIEPQFVTFQQASRDECQEIQRLRLALIAQLSAPTVDQRALKSTQYALQAHQQELQRLIVTQLLAEKAVLTPEQQGELFQLIRQQTRCMTPGALLREAAPMP